MIGLLSLFLASTCGYGFEVLDTTDKEWVAPGYEVIEEAVIDPLEYGEPYGGVGALKVGIHLSFVEVDSTEAWHVILVLDRKIAVLQEGEEPIEIPVDLDIEGCAFSPSGRFVVVHDGAPEYTGRNAARIDTQTSEVRIFDSQPNGQSGPRNTVVSNSGSVLCGWTLFDNDLDLIGHGPDIANPTAPVVSPSGTYYTVINRSSLFLLNARGELIWEQSTLRDGIAATLGGPYQVFSPDESLLAVPLETGLEIWDVATGETIWKDESGTRGSTPIFDPAGGHVWYRGLGYSLPIDLQGDSPTRSLEIQAKAYGLWRIIAASPEYVLIQTERRDPDLRRRALLSLDGEVIWTSAAWEILPADPRAGQGFSWSGQRFVLAGSGRSLIVVSGFSARAFTMRSVV
jgi:hypothetical protein